MGTKEQLLALLETQKDAYLSGEEIAERLDISRTAVWKAVKSLRDEGYPIDAVRNRGYCLSAAADMLRAKFSGCARQRQRSQAQGTGNTPKGRSDRSPPVSGEHRAHPSRWLHAIAQTVFAEPFRRSPTPKTAKSRVKQKTNHTVYHSQQRYCTAHSPKMHAKVLKHCRKALRRAVFLLFRCLETD